MNEPPYDMAKHEEKLSSLKELQRPCDTLEAQLPQTRTLGAHPRLRPPPPRCMSFLALAGLLALPVYAVQRPGPGFHWLGVYALVLSSLAYWTYAADKRRAEEGCWGVPEANLHLLELLGGWPGAFLAQRRLRHKCSKGSYELMFWLIVLAYQFAAFDSFQSWRYTHAALNYVQRTSDHRR